MYHNHLLSGQVFLVSFLDIRLLLGYGDKTVIRAPAPNVRKQISVKEIISGYGGNHCLKESHRGVRGKLTSLERWEEISEEVAWSSGWGGCYRQRVVLQNISTGRRDLGVSSVVKHSKLRRERGHDTWMRSDRTPIHVVGTAEHITVLGGLQWIWH